MAYYDFYDSYRRLPISQAIINRTIRKYLRELSRYVPSGGSVLDIGVGKGEFAVMCRDRHYRYWGCDINYDLCRSLKGRGFDALQMNCQALGIRPGVFDCVYIAHVIEHMPSYVQALETVKGIHQTLRGGGHIVLVCPDYLYDTVSFFDGDYSHSFITTRNRVGSLLADCGFDILVSKAIINGDLGWLGYLLTALNYLYNALLYPVINSFSHRSRSRAERLRTAFIPCLFFIARKR